MDFKLSLPRPGCQLEPQSTAHVQSWYGHLFYQMLQAQVEWKHGPGDGPRHHCTRSSRALILLGRFPQRQSESYDSSVSEDPSTSSKCLFSVVLIKPAFTNKSLLMASCLKEGWPLGRKDKTVPGSTSGQECGKDPGLWVCPKRFPALGRPQLCTDGRAQPSWSCFPDSGISADRRLIIHGRMAKTSAAASFGGRELRPVDKKRPFPLSKQHSGRDVGVQVSGVSLPPRSMEQPHQAFPCTPLSHPVSTVSRLSLQVTALALKATGATWKGNRLFWVNTKGNFIKNIRETHPLGEGYCPSKFVFNIHKVALENFPQRGLESLVLAEQVRCSAFSCTLEIICIFINLAFIFILKLKLYCLATNLPCSATAKQNLSLV